MEKKVYLVYESSKGCKDVVAAFTDREKAKHWAFIWKAENTTNRLLNDSIPVTNYRVYSIDLY